MLKSALANEEIEFRTTHAHLSTTDRPESIYQSVVNILVEQEALGPTSGRCGSWSRLRVSVAASIYWLANIRITPQLRTSIEPIVYAFLRHDRSMPRFLNDFGVSTSLLVSSLSRETRSRGLQLES